MEMNMEPALAYLDAAANILQRLRSTQLKALQRAAEICTHSIANDGLVHLFGTGHSRMMIEEMFPRHGSFPGFHPIVELSLTNHNQVVGDNGQRQAMFLEHVEGLARVILRNFMVAEPDSFLIFSNSGVNQVVVEMALEAKKLDLPVIAVVSLAHCQASRPQHSSGARLIDIADVTVRGMDGIADHRSPVVHPGPVVPHGRHIDTHDPPPVSCVTFEDPWLQ
jgi:uncharacterized phosphosugar-binding protein